MYCEFYFIKMLNFEILWVLYYAKWWYLYKQWWWNKKKSTIIRSLCMNIGSWNDMNSWDITDKSTTFHLFFFTSLLSKVSYKSKRHRGTKLRFWTKIMNPIVPKIERQYKFKVKLKDYRKNLHKIKSMDLIRFCIGQIDLIVGPIKGLIKFKN
jgi:hypothetical protein